VALAPNVGVVADAADERFPQCPTTMFETYRMLGRDRELELERLAQTPRRSPKRDRVQAATRHARRLRLRILRAKEAR
jgi:hypothetical protein